MGKLQHICSHSPPFALRLFSPFWHTIAATVVNDLHRRPQVAQYLSDLFAIDVRELLRLTSSYTVPFLVLTKKRDILRRVADACDRNMKILCMEPRNMAAILAIILLEPSTDMEGLIMALLTHISPEFENLDSAELIKAEPVPVASELLKVASGRDQSKRTRVRPSFGMQRGHAYTSF